MSIEHKIAAFRDVVEDIFRCPSNLLYSAINEDTRRPYTMDQLGHMADEFNRDTRGYTDAVGFMANEDSCIATGMYLQSQSDCYQVTGDPDALDSCQKSFEGLQYVYELGKQWHEGWICKPFHEQFSRTSSIDQHLFAVWGLDSFYPIASKPQQERIQHMICKIADFFMDVDYVFRYFGLPADWLFSYETAARTGTILRLPHSYNCPVFSLLAWKYTGQQRYEDEYRRLTGLGCIQYPDMLSRCKQQGFIWGPFGYPMTIGSIDTYATNSPDMAGNMPDHARNLYELIDITMRDDSRIHVSMYYDKENDSWYLPDKPGFREGCSHDDWMPFLGWMSHALLSGGMSFRTLTLIAQHAPDLRDTLVPRLMRGFETLTEKDAHWFIDETGDQVPDEFRVYTQTMLGWGFAGILFAYWRGRKTDLWD